MRDVTGLSPTLAAALHSRARADRWGLSVEAFRAALASSLAHVRRTAITEGAANLDSAQARSEAASSAAGIDAEQHVTSLHLEDLALAAACAEGLEPAWDHFVREFRPTLYRAADAIDPSGGARELADGLYADLFGLKEHDGVRQSLFRYFHGRSSLSTWLRSVLAQRHVDRLRASRRFDPLPDETRTRLDGAPVPARVAQLDPTAAIAPERMRFAERLRGVLRAAIAALAPRDRLRFSSYYAQQMKLAAIGRVLGEHETSVSRHLARTRRELRTEVERRLRDEHGLDAAAVAEGLRAAMDDPGALDVKDLAGADGPPASGPPGAVPAVRQD